MRFTSVVTAALGAVAVVLPFSSARAQAVDSTGGPELSLDQAMAIATKNSPDHLQIVEARRTAVAKRTAAYGARGSISRRVTRFRATGSLSATGRTRSSHRISSG